MSKENKFLLVILSIAAIIGISIACYQNFFAIRMMDRYSGTVTKYVSSVDKDGDGIDDATDIVDSAIAYVETRPQYQSKYYATGYPDDNYGVCTDVVAFALLNAGYDLQTLVNEDILAHRDRYNIDIVDKNIDFRRVVNLNVYFQYNAISLTTDTSDITQWQGGDIVVYNNHIAIVSDRRNEDGLPYVIHHHSPEQYKYETDDLLYGEIIGHYRIS